MLNPKFVTFLNIYRKSILLSLILNMTPIRRPITKIIKFTNIIRIKQLPISITFRKRNTVRIIF